MSATLSLFAVSAGIRNLNILKKYFFLLSVQNQLKIQKIMRLNQMLNTQNTKNIIQRIISPYHMSILRINKNPFSLLLRLRFGIRKIAKTGNCILYFNQTSQLSICMQLYFQNRCQNLIKFFSRHLCAKIHFYG